jgi:hypothetical protein
MTVSNPLRDGLVPSQESLATAASVTVFPALVSAVLRLVTFVLLVSQRINTFEAHAGVAMPNPTIVASTALTARNQRPTMIHPRR